MNFDFIIQYLILGIGVLAVGAFSFFYFYSRYDAVEGKVLNSISTNAAEIYDLLDRMFKRLPMSKIYFLILTPAVTFGLMGLALGLKFGVLLGLILAFAGAHFGLKIPRSVVRTMFQKRVEKFDEQLVQALNMMANAVKSGLSFMQVVQVIEKEMPNPCAEEFGMVLKENRVGVNLNDALLNMTKRVPSDDLFMIINSVVTLSQQGGDLSEAFDTIAVTIRERQRVYQKIRTLAQAGITQATILSIIPICMMGLMYWMNPTYIRLLFVTPVGWGFLFLMATLITVGILWMRSILKIEI